LRGIAGVLSGAVAGARQVIEAGVPRHGFQPAGGRLAVAQVIEALKGLQKDVLRHVFCLGGIRQQSQRGCVHHILVPSHERLEVMGVRHCGMVIRRQPR